MEDGDRPSPQCIPSCVVLGTVPLLATALGAPGALGQATYIINRH